MRKPNPQPICWSLPVDRNGVICTVRLYIDHAYILHSLEQKAADSKGGKAQFFRGAIVVKREKRKAK